MHGHWLDAPFGASLPFSPAHDLFPKTATALFGIMRGTEASLKERKILGGVVVVNKTRAQRSVAGMRLFFPLPACGRGRIAKQSG
jgi:hypothetical protein